MKMVDGVEVEVATSRIAEGVSARSLGYLGFGTFWHCMNRSLRKQGNCFVLDLLGWSYHEAFIFRQASSCL